MREIKFRAVAKCKYNYHTHNRQCGVKEGDFVYGLYYRDVLDNEDSGSYFYVDYIRIKYGDNYGDIEVDGDTIGEFTGMHDKNGMPIFEGDIVLEKVGFGTSGKHPKSIGEFVYPTAVIEYYISECEAKVIATQTKQGQELCSTGNSTDWYRKHYGLNECEVIGNIHQHAHLLEQNKC